MQRVITRLPEELVQRLDEAARRVKLSQEAFIRQAIEYYLRDSEELRRELERLGKPVKRPTEDGEGEALAEKLDSEPDKSTSELPFGS